MHQPCIRPVRGSCIVFSTASARGTVDIAGLDADQAAELARMLTETTQATPGDAT